MTLGGVIIDESTDDARPPEPTTADEARPDQLESEMLFGETIAWMRPNAPLFQPEPEPEPEPLPERGSSVQARGAGRCDQFAPPVADEPVASTGKTGRWRQPSTDAAHRRGGVLALVIAGGAAFALTSGGGDDAKVATGTACRDHHDRRAHDRGAHHPARPKARRRRPRRAPPSP